MCHFLSGAVEKDLSSTASQVIRNSMFSAPTSSSGATPGRRLCLTLLAVCIAFLSSSFAQQPFPTSRADNTRSNANTNETLLAPGNVNKNSFGHLFSFPVDYVVLAQPLYVPNVNIPGQGIHNVVYVVTQADSVYAIDADTGTQLWYASMLDGGITASGADLPCGYGGFKQEGILGTPAIDTTTNIMYLVAKTVRNGAVRHDIHALDITTGLDVINPVQIVATSVSNKGTVTNFTSLHQKNRPGMLILNGVLYMGFGSNGCNDDNSGWVLSYDEASLTQLGVFNTSPDWGLTSIWQAGVGLTADEQGYIYAETAESGAHGYDVPQGGQTYCNSVLKLSPSTVELADYFTPGDVAFLDTEDLDMSSTGTVVLPDQDGPYPHELIASGKQGFVYVLNRDNMGMYGTPDQIIQEVPILPGIGPKSIVAHQFGSPAFWNNTLYFAPDAGKITAFPISGGLLGTPFTTTGSYAGSHSPTISANGNNDGVVWFISGTQLLALNATNLQLLYTTNQASGGRDTLPPVAHFATQTVANGKVYVATQTSLEAYGLFQVVSLTGGGAQIAPAGTQLSIPIQVQAANPYTGQPDVGATVNFSDGCKKSGTTCGSFNPPSPVTDSNGNASTIYTVPQKAGTYTLTISGTGFGSITTTATATPGAAVKIIAYGGAKQTGAAGFNLPKPVVAQAEDAYKNGVSGVTVTFSAKSGAVLTPSSVVTDANGLASTTVQLPPTPGAVTVTASSAGLKNVTFAETAVAQVATTISITSGNNQSATAGTQLPQPLTVLVNDQFGNPFSGDSVTFTDNGAGGIFSSSNPVITGTNGTASQLYTLPPVPGPITINATAAGISGAAVFTETAQ
jgi:outer membrane protein assembly factor BamB